MVSALAVLKVCRLRIHDRVCAKLRLASA